ncbi:oligopeptide/dipeptide ABC transporter ATP-binding protein [Cutibacterium acnes]|jgi:oligopeptide/dipeptide ABC transporter ATP-binding protein|uniref:oligopeptide/dipeptide ABC transporter ATP-binding protein n=1 Tax=Cutibacterium TaxID=1912216 RepID=UPI0001EF21B8|nr:oligopeptide/dipeptide ABC transporter ATP-binding protein [Cutibacterium acnes]EFS57408.1 oligopeptide/dipeptide ABC transporter, ATP-binding protein domain protein [Cutibacterium acnes HL046PA2]EFS59914.1 oligopeptide/dipeptide ABC transporter, ATP-binding protein domain protein [Cutibacterium acnes HL036PA1]EFS61280.1 oligopeptide/dipeptide ABC transporter, ATP-binding protein domain protein [Cutibacterium acnes HL036PA2]EFS88424.1 oligopeptide/dipeptide ABC transporter, ATP-binding prote
MTGAHVDDRTAVLEARNVSLDFDGTDSSGSKVTIHALDRVNLTIHRGEITALVGESGSGKTSIARLFALIYKPTSGELYRNGELVHVHGKRAERAYYRDVQLIYQDPFASLNGLKKISTILGRVFKIHYPKMRRKEIAQRIDDVLTKVNMTPPSRYICDRINVMYGGRIVEAGPTKQIISDTIHPYTRLLLSAAPDPARYKGSANSTAIDILEGAPMNNSVRVKGCRFAPLCPLAQPRCTEEELPKFHSEDGTREVTCWEAEERREFHRV